jgi:hypothetical protein
MGENSSRREYVAEAHGVRGGAEISLSGARYVRLPEIRVVETEVASFGFRAEDFKIDARGLPRACSKARAIRYFAVTVTNVRSARTATYVGGPGKAWVADFLNDLINGGFGDAVIGPKSPLLVSVNNLGAT